MKINSLRLNLERKLKRRGWIKTVNNKTLQGPDRQFKTISEELIWALNESGTPLSINDLSHYLDFNKKSIQKSLRKICQYPLGNKIISREKIGNSFVYGLNVGREIDIPTVFRMMQIS